MLPPPFMGSKGVQREMAETLDLYFSPHSISHVMLTLTKSQNFNLIYGIEQDIDKAQ